MFSMSKPLCRFNLNTFIFTLSDSQISTKSGTGFACLHLFQTTNPDILLQHFDFCAIGEHKRAAVNRTAQHAAAQSAVFQGKEKETVYSSEVSLFKFLLPLFRFECSHAEIWIVSSSLRSHHLTLYPHPGG